MPNTDPTEPTEQTELSSICFFFKGSRKFGMQVSNWMAKLTHEAGTTAKNNEPCKQSVEPVLVVYWILKVVLPYDVEAGNGKFNVEDNHWTARSMGRQIQSAA